MTDATFGFDTALGIVTEAIDRLHSTAHSHHRIIVVEIMGHNTGWLALGSGIAGGADVILIPEIPYDVKIVAEAILQRSRSGHRFSIVAVSEGAISKPMAEKIETLTALEAAAKSSDEKSEAKAALRAVWEEQAGSTWKLSQELESLTGLESRVTILGHVQRGGMPSAVDRLLGTRLGTACAELIQEGVYGVMVASQGAKAVPVPLEQVVGNRKSVPLEHPWVKTARYVGTCLGDEV